MEPKQVSSDIQDLLSRVYETAQPVTEYRHCYESEQEVYLDGFAGGGHKDGEFSHLRLRFKNADGSESTREYIADDITKAKAYHSGHGNTDEEGF